MKNYIEILGESTENIAFVGGQYLVYIPDPLRKALNIIGKQRLPLLVISENYKEMSDEEKPRERLLQYLVLCNIGDSFTDKNGHHVLNIKQYTAAALQKAGNFYMPYHARRTAGLTIWNKLKMYAIKSVDGTRRIILVPQERNNSKEFLKKIDVPAKHRVNRLEMLNHLRAVSKSKQSTSAGKEKIDPLAVKPDFERAQKSKKYFIPQKALFKLHWGKGDDLALFEVKDSNKLVQKIIIVCCDQKGLNYSLEEGQEMEELAYAHINQSREIAFHRHQGNILAATELTKAFISKDNQGRKILVLTK